VLLVLVSATVSVTILASVTTESEEPEFEAPESDEPESEVTEADEPETEVPESDKPESDVPESDEPESEVPESDEPESESREHVSEVSESEVSESFESDLGPLRSPANMSMMGLPAFNRPGTYFFVSLPTPPTMSSRSP